MLADKVDRVECVVGVDTHRDAHTLVVVDGTGRVRSEAVVSANRAGYAEALVVADRHALVRVWAVEGTGSYGAGLVRFLVDRVSGWWRWSGRCGVAERRVSRLICWTRDVPPSTSFPVAARLRGNPPRGRRCGCWCAPVKAPSRSAPMRQTSCALRS